jgi:Kef-type K+ transport system membrane component KefB
MLLMVKLVSKLVGVWPLARAFGLGTRESHYTTLLMATGLTFGTISALFGFENHLIDRTQYTVLVTVVILSAVVPTLIAQAFFQPTREAAEKIRSERSPLSTPAHVTRADSRAERRLKANKVGAGGE